ncbi:hypothetical protein ES703_09241 [subsurface metagenome]
MNGYAFGTCHLPSLAAIGRAEGPGGVRRGPDDPAILLIDEIDIPQGPIHTTGLQQPVLPTI